MIVCHIFHSKLIPNFLSMSIIFIINMLIFEPATIFFFTKRFPFTKSLKTTHMFISTKYFVLYWFKFFSTNFLRQVLPFIFGKIFNKIFQPEIDLLDTVNKNNFFREHNNHIFSRPFDVRITLSSNWPFSCIIWWLPYSLGLRNITSIFCVNS